MAVRAGRATGPAKRAGLLAGLPLVVAKFLLLVLLSSGGLPAAAAEPASGDQDVIRFRAGTDHATDRIVLESNRPIAMSRSEAGGALLLRFDRPLQGDVTRLALQLGRSILSAAVEGETLRLRLRHEVELDPRQVSDRQLVLELRAGQPAGAPVAAAPRGLPALLAEEPIDASGMQKPSLPLPEEAVAAALRRRGSAPALLPVPAAPAASQPEDGQLSITAARQGDVGVVVDYRWDHPVPAAAFLRDDRLWLVFAARTGRLAADAATLARELEGLVLDAERQIRPDSLVFRLQLAAGVRPTFAATAQGWRLSLRDGGPAPDPAAFPLRTVPSGGQLHIAASGPVLPLPDPRAGDRLLVVPMDPASAMPVAAGLFAEIEVLPSLTGLALRPLRQDILVEPEGDGLTVRRVDHQPLALDGQAAAAPVLPAPEPKLGFARLGTAIGQVERRRAEAAMADNPSDGKRRAQLVRTLLGLGLAAEARAVLAVQGPDAPALALLAAAADALADPRKVPPERFQPVGPEDAAEAALWRAYLLGAQGASGQAASALAASADVLARYPAALRRILGEGVVAMQLDHGDVNGALATIDGLVAVARDPAELAAWQLLQARALIQEDALPAARRPLIQAASLGDGDTKLAAKGAEVELDLRTGRVDPQAAHAALQAMAPSWEGHAAQASLESQRADIAALAGDWPAALEAADRAAALPAEPDLVERDQRVSLLARGLDSPDLDLFAKLALLRGRPLDELRDPRLAEPLGRLASALASRGHATTAAALQTALPTIPSHDPAGPSMTDHIADVAATDDPGISAPTRDLLRLLDPTQPLGAEQVPRIAQALAPLADPPAR